MCVLWFLAYECTYQCVRIKYQQSRQGPAHNDKFYQISTMTFARIKYPMTAASSEHESLTISTVVRRKRLRTRFFSALWPREHAHGSFCAEDYNDLYRAPTRDPNTFHPLLHVYREHPVVILTVFVTVRRTWHSFVYDLLITTTLSCYPETNSQNRRTASVKKLFRSTADYRIALKQSETVSEVKCVKNVSKNSLDRLANQWSPVEIILLTCTYDTRRLKQPLVRKHLTLKKKKIL